MRTVWSFGIPEGTQGKDKVASMGKLLSSPLKLNIREGLLSISSAWEPVKGEARRGLVRRAWPVTFSEGSQGQGEAVRGSQALRRSSEPPACAALRLACSFCSAQKSIAPLSCSGVALCRGVKAALCRGVGAALCRGVGAGLHLCKFLGR